MGSWAASRFAEAKQALATGDFQTAARLAEEAKLLLETEVPIRDFGASTRPCYSLIVNLYQRHADVGQALRHLSQYSDRPDFEVIFVNNGDFVPQEVLEYCNRFRWIEVGFNYGCSGGRNLGARAARTEFLIFIDDDGFLERNAIEQLIKTITEHDAIAVRGRVRPKNRFGAMSANYDLGDEVVYSVPNAEGISIWRRREFLAQGGFDTLLAGGEGLALWLRIYKSCGSQTFLYTPYAILLHDYAKDVDQFARKRADSINAAYFLFAYPDAHQQKWKAALEFTVSAVKTDPHNAKLQHYLGSLMQRQGRLDEAAAAHRRAIELEPALAHAHWQLSVILVKQGRDDEALPAALAAVKLDPESARAQHHLGTLMQRQGKPKEAEVALRRATELEPFLGSAHFQLSVVLAQQNRQEDAIAAVRRAIRLDPRNAKLHHHLGNLLESQGELNDAKAAQLRAVELEPELAGAYRRLSIILAQQDRQLEALDYARRAVALDPDNAKLHRYFGELLCRVGRLDEAEAAHRRAIELKPKFGIAYWQLSIVLAQQNRQEEAVTAARKAVTLDPKNAKLHRHLRDLLHNSGGLDEANLAGSYRQFSFVRSALRRFRELALRSWRERRSHR